MIFFLYIILDIEASLEHIPTKVSENSVWWTGSWGVVRPRFQMMNHGLHSTLFMAS